jgi:hypothetical protein
MESESQRRKRQSRYTGLLIGAMLSVFVGMLLIFTIFLAPVGIALIFGAIVVAGYASFRRGDFRPRHP